MDTKPLLKEACGKVFGSASGMVDMLVDHVPSSRRAAAKKVQQDYTGPQVRAGVVKSGGLALQGYLHRSRKGIIFHCWKP